MGNSIQKYSKAQNQKSSRNFKILKKFNMASFVNANLGSDSDSDDQDFDPTKEAGHIVSEEENSGDDENPENSRTKKSKKKPKQGGRIGGIFLEEDEQVKVENDAKRKEFEQEKIDLAKEAEKQKSEDLWADFKSDTPSVPKKPKS